MDEYSSIYDEVRALSAQHEEIKQLRADNSRLERERAILLEALIMAREEFEKLPHSFGYDFTHLPKIIAAIDSVKKTV